jgi:thiamine biosynthesis lipoprotein
MALSVKTQTHVSIGLLTVLLAAACSRIPERLTAEFYAMGGIPVRVTAYQADRQAFSKTVEAFREKVQVLEAQISVYRDNSLLSRAGRGEAVELPPEVLAVIQNALDLSKETGGTFDPTVGPLVALWKQGAKRGTPPGAEEIQATLKLTGTGHVHLKKVEGKTVLSLDPGCRLDLGGIAKGYLADLGARMLEEAGVRRGLVELGGDLVVFDRSENPAPFRIGVRHPRDKQRLLGTLRVHGGGVVTSGDYERYVQIAGKRYGHILDPQTGVPAAEICAVTLTAGTGSHADALATAVIVLGAKKGLELVERLPGVEALIIVETPSGSLRILHSSGIGDRFVPAQSAVRGAGST